MHGPQGDQKDSPGGYKARRRMAVGKQYALVHLSHVRSRVVRPLVGSAVQTQTELRDSDRRGLAGWWHHLALRRLKGSIDLQALQDGRVHRVLL